MVFVAALVVSACSSDGDDPHGPVDTDAPTLGPIDGPATVDPSYDPSAISGATDGG